MEGERKVFPQRGDFSLITVITYLVPLIACNLPEMNHIVESMSYFMNPWSELKTNLEV